MDELTTRQGLPDALRVLVERYPREAWEAHPNFSELTRFWLERHLMFRELLERLRSGAEAYLDGNAAPERHAREVQHYAGFLLNQLHHHHMIEDQHYFPRLQGLDDRVARGFTLLDADHQALDGHIHGLAEAANTYLQVWNDAAARDRVAEFGAALGQFETFLDRHLVDEEDIVVPVILHHAPDL